MGYHALPVHDVTFDITVFIRVMSQQRELLSAPDSLLWRILSDSTHRVSIPEPDAVLSSTGPAPTLVLNI
jgi:hypothetical protein